MEYSEVFKSSEGDLMYMYMYSHGSIDINAQHLISLKDNYLGGKKKPNHCFAE